LELLRNNKIYNSYMLSLVNNKLNIEEKYKLIKIMKKT